MEADSLIDDAQTSTRRRAVILSHAYVVDTPEGWLTKNRVGELVQGLRYLGWTLTYVAIQSDPRPYLTYRLANDVQVEALNPPRPRNFVGSLCRVLRQLRSADAVLVFMPTVRTALALVVLGPRAVMYAGAAFGLRPRTPRWRRHLEDLAARRAAAVLTAGENVRDHFQGVARRVETCVPMVAEEVGRRFHDDNEPEPKPRDRLRILFVGSVRRDKGVVELLEAFERLPEAECRVVGPIAEPELGRWLAKKAAGCDRLSVHPYLEWSELRDCYRWANVLVLPSHTEGFPRVVYEATAFGLTLVVTPVGGLPHRLEHARDAAFFRVGDVDALERTLSALAGDPDRASRLAANAMRTLASVFIEPHPSGQFARELEAVAHQRSFISSLNSSATRRS